MPKIFIWKTVWAVIQSIDFKQSKQKQLQLQNNKVFMKNAHTVYLYISLSSLKLNQLPLPDLGNVYHNVPIFLFCSSIKFEFFSRNH